MKGFSWEGLPKDFRGIGPAYYLLMNLTIRWMSAVIQHNTKSRICVRRSLSFISSTSNQKKPFFRGLKQRPLFRHDAERQPMNRVLSFSFIPLIVHRPNGPSPPLLKGLFHPASPSSINCSDLFPEDVEMSNIFLLSDLIPFPRILFKDHLVRESVQQDGGFGIDSDRIFLAPCGSCPEDHLENQ
jgi:hypothetical protein